MYEHHTYQTKQEKLVNLSALICKIAMVPEPYLGREEVNAVIEYLCDIEYDLLRQLDAAPPNPPEGRGRLVVLKRR